MRWVVDRFELVELLGSGGMGEVYRARVPRQTREVAVKILTTHGASEASSREAFQNEIRLAASLSHPHIVRVHDHGIVTGAPRPELEGAPYLAMELVPSDTLEGRLGSLYWDDQRAVLLALLGALAHAHARGVVHRDLKPANVLLDLDGGELKLTDFGLAHALDRAPVEGERTLVGTPLYMAPEQFGRNWRDFGPWTDLYAFGCLAYALATGAPPFPTARTLATARSAHRYSEPPALPAEAPVPPGFDAWLAALLAKDPGRRFQRAADAALALRELGDATGEPLRGRVALPDTNTLTSQFFDRDDTTDEEVRDARTTVALSAGLQVSDRPLPTLPRDWRHTEWTAVPDRLGLSLFGMREAPLVGRHEERDLLWSALGRAIDTGRCEGVLFTGPPGIGKSRLARWIAERSHALGVAHVLEARHAAGGGDGQGLGAMLARFLRCSRMPVEPLTERLKHIAEGLAPGTGLWRTLLGLLAPGAPGAVCFDDDAQRHRALVRFCALLARTRPLVVWLDDVHVAPRSLAFAEALVGASVPALVVATAHGAVGTLPKVEVGPLSPAQMRSMLGSLLLLDPLLMDEVAEATAGNPLLALQLVGHWVEGEDLESVTMGWRLGRRREASQDLASLWEDRLAPFVASAGEVLERAAVVGMELDSATWAAVGGTDARLDPLVRRGLVALTDPDDPGAWRFANGHVRDALIERARRAGRLAGHHRAAAALTPDPERRGRHLWAAGDAAAAEPALREAASRSHDRGEYATGREMVMLHAAALGALGASPTDPRRIAGDVVRVRILRRAGDAEAARACLADLTARATDTREPVWLEVQLLRAEIARKNGTLAEAWSLLSTALERAVAPDIRSRLLLELGEVEIDQGALDSAAERLEGALALATARRTHARALQELAELDKERGELDAAWARFERAAVEATAAGDRWCHASTLNSMGDVARYCGRLDEAVELYERAGALFDAIGSDSTLYTVYNVALVRLEQREIAAVEAVLPRAIAGFEAMGHRATWADTLIVRAACRSARGEDGIDADLATALAVYVDTGVNDADTAELAQLAGQILHEHGRDPSPALRIARHVWTHLGRTDRLEALLPPVDGSG
ncbi:MAG: protein kinase [Alphaproteobacteria bacterium]|nr:protein kinase [Alphaproteobacteria bacterium]